MTGTGDVDLARQEPGSWAGRQSEGECFWENGDLFPKYHGQEKSRCYKGGHFYGLRSVTSSLLWKTGQYPWVGANAYSVASSAVPVL